jgi:hypothetical protein
MQDMEIVDISRQEECLRGRISELETNSKMRSIRDICRGINGFKEGYQHKMDLVKDEKGGLLADCHSILNR